MGIRPIHIDGLPTTYSVSGGLVQASARTIGGDGTIDLQVWPLSPDGEDLATNVTLTSDEVPMVIQAMLEALADGSPRITY